MDFQGWWSVEGYWLSNGQVCLLTYASHPVSEAQCWELRTFRKTLLAMAMSEWVPLDGETRATLYGTGEDEIPVILDLAVIEKFRSEEES